MPATDLSLLIDAAREAGQIATGYSGQTARRWDKPGGAGPVTEADIAVNDALLARLRPERPDYGWLSEESEDSPQRLSHDKVFIIDPIDGTRSFADGSNTWAHALAVAEQGVVTAAVIYLPLRDLLYHAAIGQGAFLNGQPIAPSGTTLLGRSGILAARPVTEPAHWRDGQVPTFRREYRPSLAYRMATVAQGQFDGMLTLRPSWEWDIAAGDLILREAGAACTDRNGGILRFNNPKPKVNGVVAGNLSVHSQICAALRPV